MPESVIVVNADGPDTRVALIENGILSELYVERDRARGTVGNVYKGKVLRVLPGMQAAFVDIGEEKAAFLYAGDIASAEEAERDDKPHVGDSIPRRTGKPADIAKLVRPGQEILVQVVKDPISNKGARITSYISLPGRNVVFMPTVSHIGISRRIAKDRDRRRLRKLVDQMRPKGAGFIVRTVAESSTNGQVRADMDYLLRLWANIKANEKLHRAPVRLYRDLDLMLRVVRDNLSPELDRVICDDRVEYERLSRFVKTFMPDYADKIELYQGREPIFDGYGIEAEIDRALERKVSLPSGGSLVFDQGEALTAIDVNTGKFVGAKGKTLEETITKTNLEAAAEIGDQLRLRNLGGLVIIDFIDMDKESNRRKVYRKLQEVLRKDRAKAHITKISEMGLVEMSRKRTKESLGRHMTSPCSYCNGKGYTKSASTIAYEILRQIRRDASVIAGDSVVVHANPEVADLMRGEEASAVDETVKRIHRGIEIHARKGFHIEQFEIKGKQPGQKASSGRNRRRRGREDEDEVEDTATPVVASTAENPATVAVPLGGEA
ncbi:Rne/Rng family ribonuclease [Paraliomyxa miuraensis]|uniref:Rne/Rng family ribonuclease n=1 Tax=Paraliomyxa miuraensis TaxID=376150 RepID=UPI00224F1C8B|nr:Rne/Rng family ribonuclease [Paraliomyxa miuraensis]MCX4248005.1 Rne/Rng family ribonuclease [Paraliomyxa miuraensis]